MAKRQLWRKHFYLLLLCFVVMFSNVACIGVCDIFAQPQEITQGYYITHNEFGTSILMRSGRSTYDYVVRPDVIEFDWDEHFMVVKQNPREEVGVPDTGIIKWYIIDIAHRRTIGGMPYLDYLEKRIELSVPDELDMLAPDEALREA